MVRRENCPELRVRSAFEAARIAPQCLASAYERLVPVPRRPLRPAAANRADLPVPAAEGGRPVAPRRAERG
jgi:hypothetical protein